MKPETEIRNLKKDLQKLRIVAVGFGMPHLVVYLPDLVLKDLKSKEPRKLNKVQREWLKSKIKEFKKMIAV